jgi:hypothetical protein
MSGPFNVGESRAVVSAASAGAPVLAHIDHQLARGGRAESLLREALEMYESVTVGKIDGHAIGMLAGEIRGFLNTPEAT